MTARYPLVLNGTTIQELQSGDTLAGDAVFTSLSMSSGGPILFYDNDGSNYVGLDAPATVASNVTFTLPAADGTNGQAIVTNGSGTLSFGNAGISTGKSIAMAMIFGF